MKLKVLVVVCLTMVWVAPVLAGEGKGKKARIVAAHELFGVMLLDKTFSESLEKGVEVQIKQNPMIAPYKHVLLKFFSKYMSWESMKDEMAEIYAAEFTIKELKAITAFYKTQPGKKATRKMPQLMNKGMELSMRRIQENAEELGRMIAEEQKKSQAMPSR